MRNMSSPKSVSELEFTFDLNLVNYRPTLDRPQVARSSSSCSTVSVRASLPAVIEEDFEDIDCESECAQMRIVSETEYNNLSIVRQTSDGVQVFELFHDPQSAGSHALEQPGAKEDCHDPLGGHTHADADLDQETIIKRLQLQKSIIMLDADSSTDDASLDVHSASAASKTPRFKKNAPLFSLAKLRPTKNTKSGKNLTSPTSQGGKSPRSPSIFSRLFAATTRKSETTPQSVQEDADVSL